MRSFDRALAISDASHEANYYSAIIYQRWSDYETAYERYHAASEIDGENVQYLLAAAESLIACDRLDEAQTLLEGRLDHFEHNAAMQHLLAQVATIDGDYEAAVDHFRRARMLRSDDVVLLEGLVHAQYRAEMFGPCLDSVMELELVLLSLIHI